MKKLILSLLLIPAFAAATPFVTSDPTAQKVTHCGVQVDAGAKIDVPVVTVTPTTAKCSYDIAGISVGTHTIKATFVNIDPIWGRSESVFSVPLNFERPTNTVATPPTGLDITK